MKLITRSQYLNKLISVIGTPDIKVITGVWRSGKSKLLEAFKGYIEQSIPDLNIVHINFNLPEFEPLLEYRPLYDYVSSKYVAGRENFVLIDEVQMCADFEKAINGLHTSETNISMRISKLRILRAGFLITKNKFFRFW